MRKKWLVIGGIGLAVVAIIALTNRVVNPPPSGNACQQVIQSALDYDPGKSYGLLSDDLRQDVTEEEWKTTVQGLYSLYAGVTKQKLDKHSESPDPSTGEIRVQEDYTITTETGEYNATCYLNGSGKVTGFIGDSGE